MSNYLIITGGSHGIGEKTISFFLEKNWQAINLSRSNCVLDGVQNINVDLAAIDWPQTTTKRLQAAIKDAEKIALVHNAATFDSDAIQSLDVDDLRTILNVNLVSPISLNQIVLPFMKSGSSIIYIGSTLSEQAVANRASYVISKHAVVGLMRSTCQDLVDTGIHTCCICPGFVNTDMLTDDVKIDELMKFIQSKVIAKRLIEPEEIAEFIYFAALYPILNGSVLHANLGQVTT